jgi:formylglycine-generating enzyme required for sulfatase activity
MDTQLPRFRKESTMLRQHAYTRGLVVCLLLLSCTTVAAQGTAAQRRTALVIGNAAYQHITTLRNPVNDARAIADTLRTLGFQVILKTNTTLDTMADAVFQFGEQLKGGGVGLFYYSGHGVQVNGENYLIPVEANVSREDQVTFKTYQVRELLKTMDNAKSHLNLVFLDACRNNPFPRTFRSTTRGLASTNAPSGTLLVFATNPDNVADDGSGDNSPFTKHLLHFIRQPDLEVGMLLRRVRTAVKAETNGAQTPWENGSIEGEFYFAQAGMAPPPTPPPSPQTTSGAGTQVAVGVYPPASPPETSFPKTLRNSIGMEFVLIPAGEFQMGSNDGEEAEKPVHRVRISKAFYLGEYEVTQGQWQAVMGNNPSQFKGDPNLPVESVSWDDVQEFIRRLNAREGGTKYRLPTEAEWEYAARAGTTTTYSFGNNPSQLGECVWYRDYAERKMHPVGQRKPSAWGLYDMHGNVWEWVQDWSSPYPPGFVTDPQGPSSGSSRVIRGGGLFGGAGGCRPAFRYSALPDDRSPYRGFRLLRTAP